MSRNENFEAKPSNEKRPNYLARRIGAAATFAVAAVWGGDYVVTAVSNALECKPVASTTASVDPGSNIIDTVGDAVDELAKENDIPRNEVAGVVEAGQEASATGERIVYPGTEINVTVCDSRITGYSVKATLVED